jgi:hypothetical protein
MAKLSLDIYHIFPLLYQIFIYGVDTIKTDRMIAREPAEAISEGWAKTQKDGDATFL